ncbi:vegetatible incompatibility HET-E-1 [Fusarium acutatum]|uniref:Vegetatible incompatibility HET-E-1 n=1 Tax=Fusarium acutatum TaxID=78861 RepID=A0A8H4JF40_9HYPO|nr:vegetatible incompatibility HET-E-1 [Fusarium acutatum]
MEAAGLNDICPSLSDEKYNKCLRDLRETDPRDDKSRIEEIKGGLLKDAYRWILENDKFQEWYNASQSQLLWIKGDPGKGKTMLLCGLINELEKKHSSILSYFFCQATEAQLSNATAVLRGLIYLLVVQRPSLVSYIEDKYDHASKQRFEDGNAWPALSKIFMAMLKDSRLDGVLLIVDALDECSTDQEKLLDLIIRSSNVKWIVTSLEGHRRGTVSVAVSPDNQVIASGGWDRIVKIWDIATDYLASGSSEQTIKIWSSKTWKFLKILKDHFGSVTSVAFSPNNQRLMSGSADVASVALSAYSRCLANGLGDEMIRIWKIREHNFQMLHGHDRFISSVAFSVDSQYLASASHDDEVRVWELDQRICLHTIYVGKSLHRVSFDLWTKSQLYTDIGLLDLDVPNPKPKVNAESLGITALPASDWSSHSIHIDGEWIAKYGENVLWFPPSYRPALLAVFKSTVAAGYESGRVLIMRFSEDRDD